MDSEMLEVLIWAFIAVVMVYTLYSTLGKKQGFRDPDKWASANKRFTAQESLDGDDQSVIPEKLEDAESLKLSKSNHAVYEKICRLDPNFSLDRFIKGAEVAFSMILESFALEDKDTLRAIFSREIYEDLEKDIDERQNAGERLQTKVLKIHKMEITKLEFDNERCRITVEIESEQYHLMFNAKGDIIEGSENQTETIRDWLTFEREVRNPDPNWTVIRMEK